MKYLYMDNFRGFENTIVPITDVSFLVGENSTGKTSVLGLLDLLSDTQFWFTQRFDTEEVRFGHFKDIVSAHSVDKSSFTIGFVEEVEDGGDEPCKLRGYLMTYKEVGGLPVLSHCTFNMKNKTVSLRKTRSKVLVKSHFSSDVGKVFSDASKLFAAWRKEHARPSSGYAGAALPFDIAKSDGVPFPLLFSVAINADKEVHDGDDGNKFEITLPKPAFGNELVWLAPIRTTPKRTYDEVRLDFSPEGMHTPYLVRKVLNSKSDANEFKKKLENIGKQSGLFESIKIRQYGRADTAPFELDIVIDQKALNINTVGYGVSQALPVIVELIHRRKKTWFAVQQPEVHLHPKAQASLGDLVFELATQEKKSFLIETHSDFLIDRFRVNYKKKRATKPSSQVLFFERKNMRNTISSLVIDDRGELPVKQPKSYRSFFIHEEMKLLGL